MSDEVFGTPEIQGGEEVVPETYSVADPPKANFAAWHHPRKQFVRSEQWAVAIEEHLNSSPISGRPLAYIGLPGDDLLDIRYFVERICEGRSLPIIYLGLNENIDSSSVRRTRVDSAMFGIRTQFNVVSESSEVVSDSFASLAKPKSIAYKKLDTFGFFDIVNLDLCDGLAKNPPAATQAGNYEAIQHLLGRQFKSRQPWLFFLTTLIGDEHCEANTKELLQQLVSSNMDSCNGFRDLVTELCGSPLDDATADQQAFVINLCGLIKWLGKMCITESGWRMQTLAIDCYKMYGGAAMEDLFSVAIRFSPINSPAQDAVGLGNAQPQTDNECRIALEVMKRIRDRRNVDAIFASDNDVYQRTVAEKSELLGHAGYDPSAYATELVRRWHLPAPIVTVVVTAASPR